MDRLEANQFAEDIINYTRGTVEFKEAQVYAIKTKAARGVFFKKQHEQNSEEKFVELVIQIPYEQD